MSEIWPLLAIGGYVGTLIFSLPKQKNLVQEEIKFFAWYLFVGLLAMAWMYDRYLIHEFPPCDDCPPVDVGLLGIFRKMWEIAVIPYLEAFIVLSSLRLLILFYLSRRRNYKSSLSPR